ncbi:MAG TPA: HAD-IA family hydrolase [Burkholderiaceae bacterium]|nr:HAD-IA family hydrolase [Burkholderiaceae bacterium]
MGVAAVLFDCDGVLVDSEPITNRVLCAMLNELGLAFDVERTMRTFMGKALREELAIIEAMAGRTLPADWYEGFARRRDAALSKEVRAVPHAADAIAAIAAAGLPFAAASGADRAKMRLTLGTSGLLARFEAGPGDARSRVFGADQVERPKPAPDVYLLAARALGVPAARCAVIEDTPTGTAAGVAAGALVLGYCAHTDPRALLAAGCAATFDDMRRLPALLGL